MKILIQKFIKNLRFRAISWNQILIDGLSKEDKGGLEKKLYEKDNPKYGLSSIYLSFITVF